MEILVTTAAIASFFAIIEKFMEDRTKDEISMYVFGYNEISFGDFEHRVIGGLMHPFLKNGRLRKLRVYFLSVLMMLLVMFIADSGVLSFLMVNAVESSFLKDLFTSPINFVFVLVLSLASFPLDWLSLRVTKRFFIDRSPVFPRSLVYFSLDVFISISISSIAIILGFVAIGALIVLSSPDAGPFQDITEVLGAAEDRLPTMVALIFLYGAFFSFFSVFAISILQFTVVVTGLILHSLVKLARLNRILSERSKVHEYPITFIGILVGFIFGVCL